MREFYFDSSRFDTYLEQLGVEYPTWWLGLEGSFAQQSGGKYAPE